MVLQRAPLNKTRAAGANELSAQLHDDIITLVYFAEKVAAAARAVSSLAQ
jgi:hypothetical protein